jgi:hypothetical protein
MFEEKFVSFSKSPGLLSLADAVVVVDQDDFPAIHIAASNLSEDFVRVTKETPKPVRILKAENNAFVDQVETAIIVGSIESSPLLQRLEKDAKLDFSNIRGKWESYITAVVDKPFEGCRSALVIAGSDKRGAVFGVYSLSEQIGVSP